MVINVQEPNVEIMNYSEAPPVDYPVETLYSIEPAPVPTVQALATRMAAVEAEVADIETTAERLMELESDAGKVVQIAEALGAWKVAQRAATILQKAKARIAILNKPKPAGRPVDNCDRGVTISTTATRQAASRAGRLYDPERGGIGLDGIETLAAELAEKGEVISDKHVKDFVKKQTVETNRQAKHDALPKSTPDMPTTTYSVILADPPWHFDVDNIPSNKLIKNHYPTMPTPDICKLEVPAHDDAVLFLWVLNALLLDGLKVMESWGFKYITNFVWAKDKWGMGRWNRGQHELLLLGTRGSMPAPDPSNLSSSLIQAPRREHSRKPDEVYGVIEKMYPTAAKIELFARQARIGWDAWGKESDG